ncbi:hypothetical protein B4135_1753 [Caldibacillus debilis]|uniref:Uncharacterized protein n=1 Tax=Caldibacillus debilis TaxID=301148 RepID=A0A150M956_9BACI|nr:hypothetical protein B4135_1753 [Caldibacillus debilis]
MAILPNKEQGKYPSATRIFPLQTSAGRLHHPLIIIDH